MTNKYKISEQFCFMHIGKTAGTSLYHYFMQRFAGRSILHVSPEVADTLTEADFARHDFVLGHISHKHFQKCRADKNMFTVLRHPVDRVLSTYHFLRTWDGLVDQNNRVMVQAAKRYALLDFLKCEEIQVQSTVINHQAYFLASDWRDIRYCSPSILASAKQHLDDFLFVGITEDLANCLRYLESHMGWATSIPVKKHNVTQSRERGRKPSTMEMDAILEHNCYDLELYEYARRKWQRICQEQENQRLEWVTHRD